MTDKPIKPGFIQEHEKTKEQEHKEVKQIEKKEVVIEEQGEKKNHKLLAVCLITVFLMCIFGYILINVILPKTKYGRNTTTVSQTTVRDISADGEETLNATDFQTEAEKLWGAYQTQFECSKQEFIDNYIQYRDEGLSPEDSFEYVECDYKKAFLAGEEGYIDPDDMDIPGVISGNSTNLRLVPNADEKKIKDIISTKSETSSNMREVKEE